MTERPPTVRVASPSDEESIFRLLSLAHQENGIGVMDHEKVKDHIKYATEGKGGAIGVIDGVNGIEAAIFLILATQWYSNEWHLQELCNFVHADCRRSHHAKHLMQFAKWFAEAMGVPLHIGVLSNKRVQEKINLYKRQFNNEYGGALFLHNLSERMM